MTDNEIKKALECSVNGKCPECPYFHSYPCDKCRNMRKDALDLINRLQAEIEELQLKNSELEIELKAMRGAANCYKAQVEELKSAINCFRGYEDKIKSEARKEFAERLHEYINGIIERHEMPMFPFSIAFVSGIETKIDNLLKERESDDND